MKTCLSRTARGVSLIESCIATAMAAVVLGAVAPGFERAIERRHVEGVAAQLETDLQLTRSLAVARNEVLRLSFAGPGCYVVHTGPAGGCQCAGDGRTTCSSGADVLRTVVVTGASLRSNSGSLAFEPVKGTVTPTASVRVVGASGLELRNVINLMGRVRQCTPHGTVPGHAAC